MKLTISGRVQKKYLKAVMTAAIIGLWLAVWVIVWNMSWGWIDRQVPSSQDIKPFIIIVLLGYYLIQFLPSVINEHVRSFIKIKDLSDIPRAKEKVS